MKKKVGLISRISLMIAMLCTAIGFSFIGNEKRFEKQQVVAVANWVEGVGVVDDSNIVLSVTKVAVNADGAKNPLDDDSEVAYSNPGNYFYRDIPDLNNNYHKTLISNGSFVKLNNEQVAPNDFEAVQTYYNYVVANVTAATFDPSIHHRIIEVDGVPEMGLASEFVEKETYYVLNTTETQYELVSIDQTAFEANRTLYYKVVFDTTTQKPMMTQCTATEDFVASQTYYTQFATPSNTDVEEAILITFGQEKAEDGNLYYPINSLFVEIEHNGDPMTVPAARSEGYKRDFGFVIGQDENNEGHYKITVKNTYFNQQGYKAADDIVFEFYIINDTTYTGFYEETSNTNKYYSKPNLKLADNVEIGKNALGEYIYNQGSTSNEFPVLTYNYSLYKMKYSHTLDGAIAEYEYTYKPDDGQIEVVKKYKNGNPIVLDPIQLNQGFDSNTLVLMFTELGEYKFDFEYIYSGYPYNQPTSEDKYKVIEDMNESIPSIKLKIKGFEVNYSKKGYHDGAEMRYFTFNTFDKVYFNTVNGYPRTNLPVDVDSLGIIYSESSDVAQRTGTITNCQDVNILSQLDQSDYEKLYKGILKYNELNHDEQNAIKDILSGLKYETTDQNPVKLKSNTNFMPFNKDQKGNVGSIKDGSGKYNNQGSFYIYSSNKITVDTLFDGADLDESMYDLVAIKDPAKFASYFVYQNGTYVKASEVSVFDASATYYTLDKNFVAKYTSDTSFNNAGYYLVFLAAADENGDELSFTNYQIIAFNNLLPDVNMGSEECQENGTLTGIANPEFTKEYVKISWEEPDVFEMGLTIKYYFKEYTDVFNGIYTEDDLKMTSPVYIQNKDIIVDGNMRRVVIGKEIGTQESGKYLIVISNEKGNEWTTSFTIDKQDITGIAGYGVFESGNSYSLEKNPIQGFISNTIEDSYGATISWNDKPSGAKVYAKYQTISFVESGVAIRDFEDGSQITTNYKLNNVIDGKYEINKPINNAVEGINVLYPQGIYLFSLIDEAGNEASYMLILDNTQTFFKVTETNRNDETDKKTVYKTAEWLQYNDVKLLIETPKYKLISLGDDKDVKEAIDEVLELMNNETLNALFQEDYIQVKQNQVVEYNANKVEVNNVSISSFGTDMNLYIDSIDPTDDARYVYDYNKIVKDYGTSIIRTYYVRGENQKYLNSKDEITKSNSYIKVEINPDNSKGYILFSTDELADYPSDEDMDSLRLVTTLNLDTAHATNDTFVLFTWIMDIGGEYEVGEVKYDYYPLNLSNYSDDFYFFDNSASSKVTKVLYSKTEGKDLTSEQIKTDNQGNDRGFVTLNIENQMSQPGYYVVTRTYADGVGLPAGSNDSMVMQYHFIVDRNGIITKVDGRDVGQFIHFGLLKNETEFNIFSQYTSATTKDFIVDGETVYYNPSLETNKLPAVLNIPVGKYNNNVANYSNYYAGKLEFTLYFVDAYDQLNNGEGKAYTLFNIESSGDSIKKTLINGDQVIYYSLDIRSYIQKLQSGSNIWNTAGLREFFINSDIQKDWLSLPGHYVIVVNDRAEGSGLANSKTIAFEIKPARNPQTPIYVTPDKLYSTESIPEETTIVSSQRYIKVDFPVYDENQTKAQIFSVEYNGVVYTNDSAETNVFKKNADKWTLYVDTMPNLNDLYVGQGDYTFVVKYKLGNSEEFKYSYYAYNRDGSYSQYFQNTYTVTIDRTAPKENVDNLIANDKLSKYYGGSEIFEQSYYDNTATDTTTYFVNRYKDYYANKQKDISKIFMFVVNANTEFNSTDVKEVRFKEFNTETDLLSLPAINLNGYNTAVSHTKYGDFLTIEGCYEILEIDAAGNTTQYVVKYLPNPAYESFKITFKASTVNGVKDLIITIKDGNGWNTKIEKDGHKSIQLSILAFDDEDPTIAISKDSFYVVDIYRNGDLVYTGKTNLKEKNIHNDIKSILKNNGFGNYIIRIHTRENIDTEGIQLNYVEKIEEFNIGQIITKDGGKTYLQLDAANFTKNNVDYYVGEIRYKAIGDVNFAVFTYDGLGGYKNQAGNLVQGNRIELAEGKYILHTKDMFEIKRVYTFSTSGDATEKVEGTYSLEGNVYYSFQALEIKFVDGLYERRIQYTYDGDTKYITSAEDQKYYEAGHILFDGSSTDDGYRVLRFYPYYPTSTSNDGKLVTITVTLVANIEGYEQKIVYNLCFDTRTGVVRLTNTRNGLDQNMDLYRNENNEANWVNSSMTSGIMNLSWFDNPSNNFTLKYLLHEKVDDDKIGWINPIDLTNDEDNIYVIQTKEGNRGLYVFEVQVYSKDGLTYLGNNVYVFMVKSETADLYTVQSKTKEYDPNSMLKSSDLSVWMDDIKNALSVTSIPAEMDLYISNEELSVVEDGGQGVLKLSHTIDISEGYKLIVYRVYTTSYNQYLATLQVPQLNDLIVDDTLRVNGEEISRDPILPNRDNKIELTFTQKTYVNNPIVKQNLIRLEVYFNNTKVKDYYPQNQNVYYEINGAGWYMFKIYDLAGNCQEFTNEVDFFEVYALANLEVALLMREAAIIENGYFSEQVKIAIVNDGLYDSISVDAKREGFDCPYTKEGQIYTFAASGSYRVRFKARVGVTTLTKTLTFTIVNPEVTTSSINLNLLERYQLVRVVNKVSDVEEITPDDIDVTDVFVKVMNASKKGKFVSYEALKDEIGAGIFSGKQKFVLTYFVSDGIYPDRYQTFTFSLSNATPTIKCSLAPGESSKKSFTVTYNPGLIYREIGLATIYINDIEIPINQYSPTEIKNTKITQKVEGSGKYTIRLVSGENTLYSQTVYLKTPLNASSIIIIIVVSAVVITGVVTFILLRRKMRIR